MFRKELGSPGSPTGSPSKRVAAQPLAGCQVVTAAERLRAPQWLMLQSRLWSRERKRRPLRRSFRSTDAA